MKFIQGQNRDQTHLFPISLEQVSGPDNEVRMIDLFVDNQSQEEEVHLENEKNWLGLYYTYTTPGIHTIAGVL
ncbi:MULTISPECIES: hypothetical protein [unclassified Saccharicrinis]|uniref:hypothetical protein n=1 Tax=unclassified Saccharicrinis TaxID=2646859 RepID=UPI003D33642E